MNNINYGQIPSTIGGLIITCAFFAQNLTTLPEQSIKKNQPIYGQSVNYELKSPRLHHEFNDEDFFEQAVSSFYSRLLASQEPLGYEFEKILHENLWDLL